MIKEYYHLHSKARWQENGIEAIRKEFHSLSWLFQTPIILLNPVLTVNSRFHFFQLQCLQIKITIEPSLTATFFLVNIPYIDSCLNLAVVDRFNCRYIDECCIKTLSHFKSHWLKKEIAYWLLFADRASTLGWGCVFPLATTNLHFFWWTVHTFTLVSTSLYGHFLLSPRWPL